MFGFFKKADPAGTESLRRALGPEVAVVVSASCCTTGTAEVDERTFLHCQQALAEAGLGWPVMKVTISDAQATLGRVASQLDERQRALAQQVTQLFMTQGLSAFPLLIVDQHVVSYGGVPGVDLLRQAVSRVQSQRASPVDAAAA
jgi:hypothetical protein